MSHISKGAGRGEEVFHRVQCCEGSNPSNEERKHIRHFAGSWGEAEVTDVRQHNSGDSTAPPQKKNQTPCLQPKTDAFFLIHLPVSTYLPPLLFPFHPFSSLSPPSASSWSSHSFLSSAASKRRELTALTSSVA